MKQTIEECLSHTLEEKFNDAQIFDKKIYSIFNSMEKIRQDVIQKKSDNLSLTYLDVKDQLIEFHQSHYDQQLYMEDYRRLIFEINVLYPIAKLFGILEKFDTEMVEVIEKIVKETNIPLFIVKKGELVIFDEERYKMASLGIEQKISDETMISNIFESEAFTVK